MEELDKQLENMHEVFFVNSHHMLDKDRMQRHIDMIKQAFIDDGWRKLPKQSEVQALVDEGLDRYLKDVQAEKYRRSKSQTYGDLVGGAK